MELRTYVNLCEVLDKSCSLDAFKKNVRAEYHAGKTAKGTQHVAIALSVLRRACGVSDDVRGSPKEIVAAGKAEAVGRFIPLDVIVERGVQGDIKGTRRNFTLWLAQLRDAADVAHREATSTARYVSGKRTEQLKDILRDFCHGKRPFPNKGDVTVRDVHKPRASASVKLARPFGFLRKEGEEGPFPHLFEYARGTARFGPDFTVTMGIHGVGVSPSASTSPEASRYNVQHTAAGIRRGSRTKKGFIGGNQLPARTRQS